MPGGPGAPGVSPYGPRSPVVATQRLSTAMKRTERSTRMASEQLMLMGRRGRDVLRDLTFGLASYRSLLVAVGGIAAGKTFFQHTLGSADEMQRARLMLRATLGDQRLVEASFRRAVRLAQEIGPLTTSEAFQGMSFMVDLAGGDLEKASQMVRLAKALEAVEPSQGFGGALFALRELQSGDVRSMRERFRIMGLPHREEAQALASERGIRIEEVYYQELYAELQRRFGAEGDAVDSLLRAHTLTVRGQLNMIRTKVQDALALASLGPADELLPTLEHFTTQLDEFFLSEQWARSAAQIGDAVRGFGSGMMRLFQWLQENSTQIIETARTLGRDTLDIFRTIAGVGRSISSTFSGLIEKFPQVWEAVKQIAPLYLGLEFLSRGSLARNAIPAAVHGARSAFYGIRAMRRGSGGAGAAAPAMRHGAPLGVTPVWIVGGAPGVEGAAGGGSTIIAGSPFGRLGGIVSRLGRFAANPAVLAATAVLGTAFLGVKTLGDVFETTAGVVERFGEAVESNIPRSRGERQQTRQVGLAGLTGTSESARLTLEYLSTLASPGWLYDYALEQRADGSFGRRAVGFNQRALTGIASQVWEFIGAPGTRFQGEDSAQAAYISQIEGILSPLGVSIADRRGRRARQGSLFEASYPEGLEGRIAAQRRLHEMGGLASSGPLREVLETAGIYDRIVEQATIDMQTKQRIDQLVALLNQQIAGTGPRVEIHNNFNVEGNLDHSSVRQINYMQDSILDLISTALNTRGER